MHLCAGRPLECGLDVGASAVLVVAAGTAAALWASRALAAVAAVPHGDDQRGAPVAAGGGDGDDDDDDDHERAVLLPGASHADADADADGERSAAHRRFSATARALTAAVLTAALLDAAGAALRCLLAPAPAPENSDAQAHALAALLAAFAWLLATVTVFLAAASTASSSTSHRLSSDDSRLWDHVRSPAIVAHFWYTALILELVRAAAMIAHPHLDSPKGYKLDLALLCIFVVRLVFVVILVVLATQHRRYARASHSPRQSPCSPSASTNRTTTTTNSWIDAVRKIRKLAPFLWPRGVYLRFLVVCCFGLLLLGRLVNVLVPETYKHLVDSLSPPTQTQMQAVVNGSVSGGDAPSSPTQQQQPYFAWGIILLYTFFRFLQGGVGLLSSLQYFLWIPVGQFTTREISVRMMRHLHSLSLQFHITRKTGEILRVIDRGTASIGSLLSYIVFNILPVFIDIFVAVAYFAVSFDVAIAAIVLVTMILYIFFTIWITEWRTQFRREMNELDTVARGRAVDALLNYETVKYFGNEMWEAQEYEKAMRKYQVADWKSSSSLNLLNTAQNVVITLGLMSGLMVCARRVIDGVLTVGAFVGFITYLLQLYQPLNWFGTYYRVIQQNFVDMEKMLELLDVDVDVRDAPDATELVIKGDGGAIIVFDRVSFSYDGVAGASGTAAAAAAAATSTADATAVTITPPPPTQTAPKPSSGNVRRDTLREISFTVPAGKTVALVGPTGSGKSTILRLLYRFYDVTSGSISIDGQDIRSVTQTSLRRRIGVVPQDTVLFNDTVGFNIRYGDVGATDEAVEAAARAACVHEQILSFRDGYATRVGERGLRLSGGEKQRIAIARTVLKSPSILLLDEATSSLDNTTERQIQEMLRDRRQRGGGVCSGRTTIVVAHRLSTVVDADEILVVRGGEIVERGTHEVLLRRGEAYLRARFTAMVAMQQKQQSQIQVQQQQHMEQGHVGGHGQVTGASQPQQQSSSSSYTDDLIDMTELDETAAAMLRWPQELGMSGLGTYYQMWSREAEEKQQQSQQQKESSMGNAKQVQGSSSSSSSMAAGRGHGHAH